MMVCVYLEIDEVLKLTTSDHIYNSHTQLLWLWFLSAAKNPKGNESADTVSKAMIALAKSLANGVSKNRKWADTLLAYASMQVVEGMPQVADKERQLVQF